MLNLNEVAFEPGEFGATQITLQPTSQEFARITQDGQIFFEGKSVDELSDAELRAAIKKFALMMMGKAFN
jgi:hypothetical protein